MDEQFWTLFRETGAPEFYLLCCRARKLQEPVSA